MADLWRPMLNRIGEEIKHISFRYACMQCLLQVRSNKFSIYIDLKVELTYKIKIQPVGLFIWTSIHNDKYKVHHCNQGKKPEH